MTDYLYEATLDLARDADPRAPGGAITVALCGHWEHEGGCRWPHDTDIAERDSGHVVTTRFTASPDEEPTVRARIASALEYGEQAGPDGRVSRWKVRESI